MRIQRRSMKKARIEIIPMIDTIFFLLVFFMISTLSMSQFKGLPVKRPPKAASGQQAPAESAAITIDREGGLFLNRQAIDKSVLGESLKQQLAKNPISWSSSMPTTAFSTAWWWKSWTSPGAPMWPRWPLL